MDLWKLSDGSEYCDKGAENANNTHGRTFPTTWPLSWGTVLEHQYLIDTKPCALKFSGHAAATHNARPCESAYVPSSANLLGLAACAG